MPDAREDEVTFTDFDGTVWRRLESGWQSADRMTHIGRNLSISKAWDEILRLRADRDETATVLGETRVRLDSAARERDALKAKLYDARETIARHEEGEEKRRRWLDGAKEARGYHPNVSFDVVWAETVAKLDAAETDAKRWRAFKAHQHWCSAEAFDGYYLSGYCLDKKHWPDPTRWPTPDEYADALAALPAAEGEG